MLKDDLGNHIKSYEDSKKFMRDGPPNIFEIVYMIALLIYTIVVHDIFINENSSVENFMSTGTHYER